MTDIVAFITARINEDAAMAHAAAAFYDDADENGVSWDGHEGENQNGFMNFWLVPNLGVIYDPASGRHIARHDPARVLAEVAAKRAIIALLPEHEPSDVEGVGFSGGWDRAIRAVLEALALPYADHPDYKENWRP